MWKQISSWLPARRRRPLANSGLVLIGFMFSLGMGVVLGRSKSPQTPVEPAVGQVASSPLSDRALGLPQATGGPGSSSDDSLAARELARAGWEYRRSAHADSALDAWKRGYALAERTGDPGLRADLLQLVGLGWAFLGEYEESAEVLREVIGLRQDARDLFGEGQAWSNLGNAYVHLGRAPEAFAASESAQVRDRLTGNRKGLLANHHRIAGLLLDRGRTGEALARSDSAEAIGRMGGDSLALASVLSRKSVLLACMGRPVEALEVVEEARDLAAGNLPQLQVLKCRRAELLLVVGRTHEALDAIREIQRSSDLAPDAVLRMQLANLEGAALARIGRGAEAESVLRANLERFEGHRDALGSEASRIGLFAAAGSVYAELARCRLAAGHPEEAWEIVERGRARSLREELSERARAEGGPALDDGAAREMPLSSAPTPVSLNVLRERLRRARAMIVQYSEPGLGSPLRFVITGDALTARELSGYPGLEQEARGAIGLLSGGAPDGVAAPAFARLADVLLAGLEDAFASPAGSVVFIPPSVLSAFPFEALPIPVAKNPGESAVVRRELLGDRCAVSYLPSASALPLLEDRRVSSSGVLVFADPALPYARREARRISAGGTVAVGRRATAERVHSEEARAAAVLHFATHAIVQPLQPERTRLLLAGDGVELTAPQIERLEIEADLVTLSACDTGAGFAWLGEGTFSLTRSFLIAGARSVVSSLWPVEDRATARFMELFYARLRDGRPRDVALRGARVAMRNEGWSDRDRLAFVLTGPGHLPVAAWDTKPGSAVSERR